MLLKPPLDNSCSLLRMLVTVDVKPTMLSEKSIDTLGGYLSEYLMDVVKCIPEDDDKHTLSNRLSTLHYYLLPCFFLFDRCHKLMNLVLKSMRSTIGGNFSAISDTCIQSRKAFYNRVNAVASLLLLMQKDPKLQQILSLFKADIDNILQVYLQIFMLLERYEMHVNGLRKPPSILNVCAQTHPTGFNFEEKERERLMKPFRRTLVVKLLGRQPSYGFMVKKLKKIWERKGKICNKCGRVGHMNEGCEAFHRKLNEGSMAVDETERKDNNGVLHEETGEEELPHGGVAEQGGGPRRATSVDDLGKEVPQMQNRKGHKEGMKGLNKENLMSKSKSKTRAKEESTMEKDTKVRVGLVTVNQGGVRKELSENIYDHDTVMVVSETNLDLYEGRGVQSELKENIHPGDNLVADHMGVDGGTTSLLSVSASREVQKSGKMCMEEECSGAASKGVAAVIREFKFRYKVNMIVLLEPRISGRHADKVIKSWGFRHSVRMEAEGFSGGIWILWDLDNLIVDVRIMNDQFIHCKLGFGGKKCCLQQSMLVPRSLKGCSCGSFSIGCHAISLYRGFLGVILMKLSLLGSENEVVG
ncbi:hypothetical protein K1719_028560 [Acacia pycnantha]|nr:hypothetical protein K1719_028560 [Acacia pycnantha]